MDDEDWQCLLTDLNQACLASIPYIVANPPPELGMQQFVDRHSSSPMAQVAIAAMAGHATWLGMPPATQEQITSVEQRLGVTLPSTYTAFLRISNGFLMPGQSTSSMLPVELIAHLGDDHTDVARFYRETLDSWPEEVDDYVQNRLEGRIQLSGPPNHRPEFVLLDPQEWSPKGEMEVVKLVHEGAEYIDSLFSGSWSSSSSQPITAVACTGNRRDERHVGLVLSAAMVQTPAAWHPLFQQDGPECGLTCYTNSTKSLSSNSDTCVDTLHWK